jgi:hypothetical protein
MPLTPKQKQIVKIYASLAKKNKKYPSRSDLVNAGISRDRIRDHFGNMENLKKSSKEASPASFEKLDKKKELHPLHDFTKEALGNIIKENEFTEGTFFVTAASPTSYLDWSEEDHANDKLGLPVLAKNVFQPGFKAVQNFLKRAKAELIVLPMPAHVKALQEQPTHYDPDLLPFKKYFATEFTFNEHLKAFEAVLNPQQMQPLTGLKRLKVHKYTGNPDNPLGGEIKRFKTSLIVAHSKQMMDTVPTGNESHPRIVHSTGAITKPSYLRNRIGMIADQDHKLGGLIVEISGDVFWIRQVQFNPVNGSFIDKGTRYHSDGTITEERAEAFKFGDIHPGFHHEYALKAIYELWDIIKPKRIFFEDFFDGASISHHTENKRLTRAKLPDYFKDIPTEIAMAQKVLKDIWDHAPKDAELIATASNHPDHLYQYLDRGAYIRDCKENYKIAHRMIVMDLDGKDPLQQYLDPEKRMFWSDQDKDYYVEGVQFNAHGHLGIGGARGSKQGHELAYGSAMTAHTHTPSIYHNAFCVGHTTIDRHGYNHGPQTWILCSGAVYKGGHMQLYMIVKGSAFRPKRKKSQTLSEK